MFLFYDWPFSCPMVYIGCTYSTYIKIQHHFKYLSRSLDLTGDRMDMTSSDQRED